MHWFRKGLRLHDNPALLHALSLAKAGGAIYPVYVVDPNSYSLVKCSVMRANFILECVKDLDDSLRECGSRLYVVTGDPVEELPKLWKEFGVTHMTHEADETGEPYAVQRDADVKDAAMTAGVSIFDFASETLHPLGNREGGYVTNVGGFANNIPTTMSSFQKLLSRIDRGSIPLPLESPGRDNFPKQAASVDSLDKYRPLAHPCEIPWPRGYSKNEIGPVWDRNTADKKTSPIVKGGESLALAQLQKTVTARPDWSASFEKPKTSCTEVSSPSTTVLSPYLSVGCISPRTAWHAVSAANAKASSKTSRSTPPVSLHGQ